MATLGETRKLIINIFTKSEKVVWYKTLWDADSGNMYLECWRCRNGGDKILDVIVQYIGRAGEKINLDSEIHGVLTYLNDGTNTYDELRDKINQVL